MDDPAVANAVYWLSWMPVVRNTAAALVAFGVFMEFAEGWVSEPWRKTVDDARTKEIAQLTKDAATLTQQNLLLQQELIATQHTLANRWLWPDKQAPIIEKLSKFAGMTAHVAIYPSTSPDTFSFGLLVGGMLESAKWKPLIWEVHSGLAVPGIIAAYRVDVPNAKEAAEAFAESFRPVAETVAISEMTADEPVWIPADARLVLTDPNVTPTKATEAIRIFIGGKVNPFR